MKVKIKPHGQVAMTNFKDHSRSLVMNDSFQQNTFISLLLYLCLLSFPISTSVYDQQKSHVTVTMDGSLRHCSLIRTALVNQCNNLKCVALQLQIIHLVCHICAQTCQYQPMYQLWSI